MFCYEVPIFPGSFNADMDGWVPTTDAIFVHTGPLLNSN